MKSADDFAAIAFVPARHRCGYQIHDDKLVLKPAPRRASQRLRNWVAKKSGRSPDTKFDMVTTHDISNAVPADLFLQFVQLDDERKILHFAGIYGLLNSPSLLGDDDDFEPEPLEDWWRAIAEVKQAMDLAHAASCAPKRASLRLSFRRLVNRHLYGSVNFQLAGGVDNRIPKAGYRVGERRNKSGEEVEEVRWLPRERISHHEFVTCLVPSNLKAILWIQLAESVSARRLRRCEYSGCREWFLVSGRRADTKYCGKGKQGNQCRTRRALDKSRGGTKL